MVKTVAHRTDWSNLSQVKQFADRCAAEGEPMTVVLRPGMLTFSLIRTVDEERLLRDAAILYRAVPATGP